MYQVRYWNGDKLAADSLTAALSLVQRRYPQAHASIRPFRTVVWEKEYDRIGDSEGRYSLAEILPPAHPIT